jgi:hypothetical protein
MNETMTRRVLEFVENVGGIDVVNSLLAILSPIMMDSKECKLYVKGLAENPNDLPAQGLMVAAVLGLSLALYTYHEEGQFKGTPFHGMN